MRNTALSRWWIPEPEPEAAGDAAPGLIDHEAWARDLEAGLSAISAAMRRAGYRRNRRAYSEEGYFEDPMPRTPAPQAYAEEAYAPQRQPRRPWPYAGCQSRGPGRTDEPGQQAAYDAEPIRAKACR
ncbi:hypothetical protein [Stappia sp.]|uniref:hypothetical protein n=1 Tax=Stappia sp. TaxID=1870903 RepID=UPI003A99BA97